MFAGESSYGAKYELIPLRPMNTLVALRSLWSIPDAYITLIDSVRQPVLQVQLSPSADLWAPKLQTNLRTIVCNSIFSILAF
jgi:hypothetical protein